MERWYSCFISEWVKMMRMLVPIRGILGNIRDFQSDQNHQSLLLAEVDLPKIEQTLLDVAVSDLSIVCERRSVFIQTRWSVAYENEDCFVCNWARSCRESDPVARKQGKNAMRRCQI